MFDAVKRLVNKTGRRPKAHGMVPPYTGYMMKIHEAIRFADKCHKGQFRKGNGLPYITHPIAVSYLLARYKASKHLEELIIASILHDVLEDTSATHVQLAKKFGPMVASIVSELTNDPVQIAQMGKLDYQTKKVLGISSYALVCKLVDRLHNISDGPSKKMVIDTVELMARLKKGRKLSKTQQRIVTDIEMACAQRLQTNPSAS